ncbi:hypothetical protein H072_9499 [Dactylellina haptotyla CBS 200.50]|uniref:Major facilitator superfamily (MFS) profile domain-containing protein n=1 Tax=Dactylellina haptotyla (strain CBS 200.50) TaxID=1284197 RepID=S8A2F3_DACHA|nr:hypothetical protein H072_9499 [Dactylellina haptotyla CBS 200.50]
MSHQPDSDPVVSSSPASTNGRAPNRNRTNSTRRNRSRSRPNYNSNDVSHGHAHALASRKLHHPGVALDAFRRHSLHYYQSFPSHLRPPTNSGRPLTPNPTPLQSSSRPPINPSSSGASNAVASTSDDSIRIPRRFSRSGRQRMASPTPIPTRKLLVLALIALAEQTAFNSISPYLPEMVGQFPGVEPGNVGVSVGMIASAFALAQFQSTKQANSETANFFWGHLSDRIGRKPVILCGTILTAGAFVLWGFTSTLWEAILVQALMGMVNGNQGVVSTVLGEITDRSNQSAAFAYLPVVYGIGAILGPIVGGLLSSSKESRFELVRRYPYCLPNIASAILLALDFTLCIFFLDESLAEARELPPLGERIQNLFSWLWQFTSAVKPTYLTSRKHNSRHLAGESPSDSPTQPLLGNNSANRDEQETGYSDDNDYPSLFASSKPVPWNEILTPSTIVLLATYFIFNLAMVGYNSLYPIFVSSPPPIGRATPVKEIGLSLAFAGVVTIFFQVLFFARLQYKAGNEFSFKAALGLFALTFFAMPLIGYEDNIGKVWLWVELAVVLTFKVVSSITALTCAMILITNCAPNTSQLGSINGLAQTLSAAGRAFGPFASGGLFTLGTRHHNGEWIPWGIFGGVAIVGFIVSLGIRQQQENLKATEVDSTGQPVIQRDVEPGNRGRR